MKNTHILSSSIKIAPLVFLYKLLKKRDLCKMKNKHQNEIKMLVMTLGFCWQ